MDTLDKYLREDFQLELDVIERLQRAADDALATLTEFEKDGEWPYELSQGSPPSLPAPNNYSFSTSAMILYAMDLASNHAGDVSALRHRPNTPPSEIDHKKVRDAIGRGIDRLLKQFKECLSSTTQQHATTSKTFGADDPFTLLWLLELLRPLSMDGGEMKTSYDWFVQKASQRVGSILGRQLQPSAILNRSGTLDHAFPLLRIVQIYDFLKEQQAAPEIELAGPLHYLRNHIHQHLSYFSVPDGSFDAAELAFAMEASVLLDREALDEPLVERCLQVLEESQSRNPYWRPLRPFIANEQGMVLLPLSVEIANSMLRVSDKLQTRQMGEDCGPRYFGLFKRYTKWLFSRIVRGTAMKDRHFMGWHSEHADAPGKIHLWETSQVLIFVVHYAAFLRRHRADQSRKLSNLSVRRTPVSAITMCGYWHQKIAPKEPLRGIAPASDYAVYSQIYSRYIQPRIERALNGREHYSALLYGPQGTGKTTLAEDIAYTLGQDLITVTPSNFTIGGEAAVEAQAKAIFDVLGAQSDCVILFDEIDRLILDRDSILYDRQGDIFQFMTPGMLTKFNDLRRQKRVIFIISTNFAERIDPAIKRVGRIDDHFLLLPPDAKQREYVFMQALEQAAPEIAATIQTVDGFADILKETVLMIPGEIQNVAKAALDAGVPALAVSKVLDAVKRTKATIRLSSYRSRFKIKTSDQRTVQEPHTEFLMLSYLLIASGRTRTTAEAEIMTFYGTDVVTGGLEEHVHEHISDPKIAQVLISTLEEASAK